MAEPYTKQIIGTGNIIGDKENKINLITPDFTANTLYNIRGYDYGVLKNILGEFNAIANNNILTLNAGQCQAYGYDGYLPIDTQFIYQLPTNTEKYIYIYAEWDLSKTPNIFSINDLDAANDSEKDWSEWQSNLQDNSTGIFQLPLWRFKLSNVGITDLTDLRGKMFPYIYITIDDNGRLITDKGNIIPSEKTLWEGNPSRQVDLSNFNIGVGTVLDVYYQYNEYPLTSNSLGSGLKCQRLVLTEPNSRGAYIEYQNSGQTSISSSSSNSVTLFYLNTSWGLYQDKILRTSINTSYKDSFSINLTQGNVQVTSSDSSCLYIYKVVQIFN